MSVIKQSREMPYTAEQMFAIVNDIELYGEFLPYFEKSVVHHRDIDEVQATLVVSAAGMKKSFTTHNRMQHNKMIEIRLVDGPFSHLEGFWRFDETPTGCLISFDLEFQFSTRLMGMLLEPVFEQVTQQMLGAFCDRAEALHAVR